MQGYMLVPMHSQISNRLVNNMEAYNLNKTIDYGEAI